MNVRLVNIDPTKSPAASVIYTYGQEKYEEGLYTGAIYAGFAAIFLLCVREYCRC
jgi:hypothetical protein